MKALVIVEHEHTHLASSVGPTLGAAIHLTSVVDALVIGYQCEPVVTAVSQLSPINQVLVFDHSEYQPLLAENLALVIAEVAKEYDYVLAPATTFGKNLLPRVAALWEVEMLSEVIGIHDPETFVRPLYAGNALATLKYTAARKVLTIRPTAFSAPPVIEGWQATVLSKERVIPNTLSQRVSHQVVTSERPELTRAKIVVVAGRGIKNEQNRLLIEQLADRLGAAIGATRAAVDMGLFPNDYQVGQTGKSIAPELYLGIGLSGAPQHLAGIRESKVIVAINIDPNAPIFQVADYGLVADLEQVVPQMIAALDS